MTLLQILTIFEKRSEILPLIEIEEMIFFFQCFLIDISKEQIIKSFTEKSSQKDSNHWRKIVTIINRKDSLYSRCHDLFLFIGETKEDSEEYDLAIAYMACTMFSKEEFFSLKTNEFLLEIIGYTAPFEKRIPFDRIISERQKFKDLEKSN